MAKKSGNQDVDIIILKSLLYLVVLKWMRESLSHSGRKKALAEVEDNVERGDGQCTKRRRQVNSLRKI